MAEGSELDLPQDQRLTGSEDELNGLVLGASEADSHGAWRANGRWPMRPDFPGAFAPPQVQGWCVGEGVTGPGIVRPSQAPFGCGLGPGLAGGV